MSHKIPKHLINYANEIPMEVGEDFDTYITDLEEVFSFDIRNDDLY